MSTDAEAPAAVDLRHAPDDSPSHRPKYQAPGLDGGGDMEVIIRPRPGWIAIDWREMWAYRELFFYLVMRDVSIRYKQTVLGPAWAVIQPLLTMGIFTLVFGRGLGIRRKGSPTRSSSSPGCSPGRSSRRGSRPRR